MDNNLENDVTKLNQEVAFLRQQLQQQQLQSTTYRESLNEAKKQHANKPSPVDLNPIIKQIRSNNLSTKEKTDLLFPEMYPSNPDEIYYQWIGPSRITVKRDKVWYWVMALLVAIIIALAVIVREYMWIAVILSFVFAIYVSNTIPPTDVVYKLTKQGIEVGEGEGLEIYGWNQLLSYAYYFKHNTEFLNVDTLLSSPQNIQILFSQEDRKNINMIMESHVPYKSPPKQQGILEKSFNGYYIPIQDFKALQQKIDSYYDEKYADIVAELKRQGQIPDNVTVSDIRNAESIQTMKLLDEVQKKQELEAKRILGI